MGTGSSAMLKHTMKREKKLKMKMIKSHKPVNTQVEAGKVGAKKGGMFNENMTTKKRRVKKDNRPKKPL